MRRILILILVCCYQIMAMACDCGNIPEISEYDYIALVEIIGVSKSEVLNSETDQPFRFHDIIIKTKIHYKGKKQKSITINGGNAKYNLGITSCDMNMEIGEEWIIFGWEIKDRITTGYCSRTRRHSNTKQEVDLKYSGSLKLLNELNKTFSKEPKFELITSHYPNGKLRISQTSYNDLQEGERRAFYSNGQIMLVENYSCGLKNGAVIWYHSNGNIHRRSTFIDGKEVCETFYYAYSGVLQRVNYYDDNGNKFGNHKRESSSRY